MNYNPQKIPQYFEQVCSCLKNIDIDELSSQLSSEYMLIQKFRERALKEIIGAKLDKESKLQHFKQLFVASISKHPVSDNFFFAVILLALNLKFTKFDDELRRDTSFLPDLMFLPSHLLMLRNWVLNSIPDRKSHFRSQVYHLCSIIGIHTFAIFS